LSVIKKHHSNN